MIQPSVDVVIAVHTPERDLIRSAGSVLRGTAAGVRVTVVCHNTPTEGIRSTLGPLADDPRLRLVALSDDIRSPAGPFNRGLELAEAPFTAVLGSDDELETGAIDSWLGLAEATGAAAVLARVRHASGPAVPSPPTRPLRSRRLDGVRDRLSYRSAPLGLVSRREFSRLRFTEGVRTGEDIAYVTELWFSGLPIAYDRSGPAYLIHADGAERVTTAAPPIADDLEFLRPLLRSDRYARLADAERSSLLMKLVRSTLFGLLHNRPDEKNWSAEQRHELAIVSVVLRKEIEKTVLGERGFSRADIALLEAASDPSIATKDMLECAAARRRFVSPRALTTTKLRDSLRRDAPLRFAAASLLARY